MNAAAVPDIKRAGLPVDLDRLTVEGDGWLSAGERYALKTYGVCAQAQPGVFMVRCRTGGSMSSDAARMLAGVAEKHGTHWLHLTTRQQVELHHVGAREVAAVLEEVRGTGLTTDSACGHTMRGVMSCPDAGVGLEEPFDCSADARAVADSILELCPALNTRMPQRINIGFGGCAECRDHARLNDAGFVSVVAEDGRLGYELWVGGSLGKSSPTLAAKIVDFVPRGEVLPAVHALFDVFVTHGNFDQPAKARLKFLIRKLGAERFLELFGEAFSAARTRTWPAPAPVSTPLSASIAEILAHAPEGGWGSGVRPQRIPGRAMVTVNIPLGDLDCQDLRALADLADGFADERLYLTGNQNVMFRHVPVWAVPSIRAELAALGLGLDGADQSRDVRACTGGPVCGLALTPAQRIGADLLDHPALVRNSGLRVHVSGCPNSCAQHQIADLGLSGSYVTIDGVAMHGYQIWLGGDLRTGTLGQLVGRVAEADVEAVTEAVIGVWEALRGDRETVADTVARIGIDGFRAHIDAVFHGRWAPGEEGGESR